MFYPVDSLRRGGRFYLCWIADSWPLRFATITHRQLWSQDTRDICNDLLEVIKNESGRPTNRFSLRLSSQLLRGLVYLIISKDPGSAMNISIFNYSDICMINAHVMKTTHKHYRSNDEESERIINSLELPRIILEVQPDEEAVEEKIQNSGNIVAHIEDITLKEPTLPENKILLDDGFGELSAQHPLRLVLGDRSIETMLFREAPQLGTSALEGALEASGDRTLDRTRLQTPETRMERLSELDITLFGKSMGEGMLLLDLEKDIPALLPASPPLLTDRELEKDKHKEKEIEKSKLRASDEILLEELEEEPQTKRRKLKKKLIIDKNIKLSSEYIRSRLEDVRVETRELRVPPPAGPPRCCRAPAGPLARPARPLGAALSALHRTARAGTQVQETILQRHRRSSMRTILEKVDEEVETVDAKYEGNLQLQEFQPLDVTHEHGRGSDPAVQGSIDLADLPTQRLLETSQAKKRVGEEQRSSKRRRSGYTSFRHSQKQGLELAQEAIKENIPEELNQAVRLTALLQRAGLADSERECGGEAGGGGRGLPLRGGSPASETPLGSLDRTKVSLGDSDNTTDSKKFIREEWGTQGAMHKIYRCIQAGASPLDLQTLLSAGPLLAGHRRLIAAQCFTSILKLRQHGFINISKDFETCEIKDISLGTKIIQGK